MPVIQICLAIVLTVAQSAPAAKPDPREQLPTAIAEGIRLLEAKQYLAFISAFVTPAEVKSRSDRGDLEAFAQKFGESPRAAALLAALKEIQQVKPIMDKGDTVATFPLSPMDGRPNTLRFEKIGKYWHLAN